MNWRYAPILICTIWVAGCATTEHADDASREAQRKAWDDMTLSQKVLDVNLWVLEEAAYSLGQSGTSFKP